MKQKKVRSKMAGEGQSGRRRLIRTSHERALIGAALFGLAVLFAFAIYHSVGAQEIEWLRQFGAVGPAYDGSAAVSTDGTGNAYVAGYVNGTFPDQTSFGGSDAFVRKYDSAGEAEWTDQFGSAESDGAEAICSDSTAVYVAGWTYGTLGEDSAGDCDAFVRKYNSDAGEAWTRQFGTEGRDGARAITMDSTGVYVAGHMGGDAFVRKYDSDGNVEWTCQFGDTQRDDYAYGICSDDSGVYVAGWTRQPYPYSDAFVCKCDPVYGEVKWTHQFGTQTLRDDEAYSISSDSTGVYVAGFTNGTLPGQTKTGGYYDSDAFVRKYDPDGNELWTSQFGTGSSSSAWSICSDDSGVYVAGRATGAFPDCQNAGRSDSFVRKYDSDGTVEWTDQFGTEGRDGAYGITVDSTGVYVAGMMAGHPNATRFNDAFVRKCDSDGNESWTRQFGAAGPAYDRGYSIVVDGNVYVAGEMEGTFSDQTIPEGYYCYDAFVREYDSGGNEGWTRQFGTESGDFAYSICSDDTGVYVAGDTAGALPGCTSTGTTDAFVRKYESDGTEGWTCQFGTDSVDCAYSICSDDTGVYVAGYTTGALPGCTSAGGEDAFVRKYDPDGNELWTRQFGTVGSDEAECITSDSTGVYVAGYTTGTLPGHTSAGNHDAFVRKYDPDGNELWTRQFGTESGDFAYSICSDSTGVYVAGATYGTFPRQASAGDADAFVRKYDPDGKEVWTCQFGTAQTDSAHGVSSDSTGVYVAGNTSGTFPGQASAGDAGDADAFVRKFDSKGREVWTCQFGTPSSDQVRGICSDSTGVYVAGTTWGIFPQQNEFCLGHGDVFVAKLSHPAVDALENLIARLAELNIKGAMLNAALIALDNLKTDDDVAAIQSLGAFILAVEAQRGKKISEEVADELIAAAQEIIAVLTGV